MKNHRLANVTAIMTIFVVLLLSPFSWSSYALADDVVEHKEVSTFNGLSQDVVRNLILAYQIGKEVVDHPEYIQAIMMQESRGVSGQIGNKAAEMKKRSYGLMQVQIPSARSILKQHSRVRDLYFPNRSVATVSDVEIERLLLHNDEANVRIAAHHFKRDLAESKGNIDRALASYNLGSGGVKKIKNHSRFPYVVGVKRHLQRTIVPFNVWYKSTLTFML